MRRISALPIGCIVLASLTTGCPHDLTAESIEKSPAALVQQAMMGTSTWVVAPDGAVSATLKAPDGKPITQPVTGQMTFATPDGPPQSVPVKYEPKTGVLTAAGPKLDADITPVSYALTVGGAPWNGAIDVPRGGTLDLADTAKLQAPLPPGLPGPNGGVVQVVGPDRVEVVANRHTGDVRAYVLDADNKPVDPGDRKITLALQGEDPEVLVLAPEPQAHFVVGHIRTRVDPVHVTVAVNAHGKTHACLVGWAPGAVVVTGPAAPRVHLLAVEGWPGEVVEMHGHHGHVHGEVVVGEPGVYVTGPHVEGPSVVVAGPHFVAPPPVIVGAPGVVVGGPGVIVGPPGVVVGAPPHVVVGGPSVVVGGPGVVVGGQVGFGHHKHER
jgi:hypothetical protein